MKDAEAASLELPPGWPMLPTSRRLGRNRVLKVAVAFWAAGSLGGVALDTKNAPMATANSWRGI